MSDSSSQVFGKSPVGIRGSGSVACITPVEDSPVATGSFSTHHHSEGDSGDVAVHGIDIGRGGGHSGYNGRAEGGHHGSVGYGSDVESRRNRDDGELHNGLSSSFPSGLESYPTRPSSPLARRVSEIDSDLNMSGLDLDLSGGTGTMSRTIQTEDRHRPSTSPRFSSLAGFLGRRGAGHANSSTSAWKGKTGNVEGVEGTSPSDGEGGPPMRRGGRRTGHPSSSPVRNLSSISKRTTSALDIVDSSNHPSAPSASSKFTAGPGSSALSVLREQIQQHDQQQQQNQNHLHSESGHSSNATSSIPKVRSRTISLPHQLPNSKSAPSDTIQTPVTHEHIHAGSRANTVSFGAGSKRTIGLGHAIAASASLGESYMDPSSDPLAFSSPHSYTRWSQSPEARRFRGGSARGSGVGSSFSGQSVGAGSAWTSSGVGGAGRSRFGRHVMNFGASGNVAGSTGGAGLVALAKGQEHGQIAVASRTELRILKITDPWNDPNNSSFISLNLPVSATSFEGTPASFGSSGYSSSMATKIEEIVDLRKGRSAAASIGYGRLGPAYGATDIKWGSLETAGKIAMGCKNGSVAIWDVASQSLDQVKIEHDRSVNRILFAGQGGNWLISGGQDGYLKLWDLRENRPSRIILNTHSDPVRDMAFRPTPAYNQGSLSLVSCAESGAVVRWDLRNPSTPVNRVEAHLGGALCLAWRAPMSTHSSAGGVPEGDEANWKNEGWLATAGMDRTIKIWDMSSGSLPQRPIHVLHTTQPPQRLQWRPDFPCELAATPLHSVGRTGAGAIVDHEDDPAASLAASNEVEVWDVRRSYFPKYTLAGGDGVVSDMIFNDSTTLWTVYKSTPVFVQHDLLNDAHHPIESVPRAGLSWTPDGEMAFLAERWKEDEIPFDDAAYLTHPKAYAIGKKRKSAADPPYRADQSLGFALGLDPELDTFRFRQIADTYVLGGKPLEEICTINAKIAAEVSQFEQAQVWRMIGHWFGRVSTSEPAEDALSASVDISSAKFTNTPLRPDDDARSMLTNGSPRFPLNRLDSPAASVIGLRGPARPTSRPGTASGPNSRNLSPHRGVREVIASDYAMTEHAGFSTNDEAHPGHPGRVVSQPVDLLGSDSSDSKHSPPELPVSPRTQAAKLPPVSLGFGGHSRSRSATTFSSFNTSLTPRPSKHSFVQSTASSVRSTSRSRSQTPSGRVRVPTAMKQQDGVETLASSRGQKSPTAQSEESSSDFGPDGTASGLREKARRQRLLKQTSQATIRSGRSRTRRGPELALNASALQQSRNHSMNGGSTPGHSTLRSSLFRDGLMMAGLTSPTFPHGSRGPGSGAGWSKRGFNSNTPRLRSVKSKENAILDANQEAYLMVNEKLKAHLRELLKERAEQGDVQFCAAVVFAMKHRISFDLSFVHRVTKTYLDLLYRNSLPTVGAYLVKHAPVEEIRARSQESTTIYTGCGRCGKGIVKPPYGVCASCSSRPTKCSICHLSVKSSFVFCPICGHGTHESCLADYIMALQGPSRHSQSVSRASTSVGTPLASVPSTPAMPYWLYEEGQGASSSASSGGFHSPKGSMSMAECIVPTSRTFLSNRTEDGLSGNEGPDDVDEDLGGLLDECPSGCGHRGCLPSMARA